MLELAVFVSLITWAAVYYSIRAIGQVWVESAYDDWEFVSPSPAIRPDEVDAYAAKIRQAMREL